MGILQKIIGYATGNGWEIDANNNGKVNLPTTIAQAGFAAIAGRNDDGSITGTPRVNRVYVSEANALKAAVANILWDDTFNALAQNTGKYNFAATTQTGSQAGGYLILNTSAITTINTNSGVQTFRSFPVFAKSETRVTIAAMLTQVPQANNLIEFGLFSAVLATRVAPLDGVFFRYNAAGELRGVVNYNGVETQTGAITPPSASVNHDFTIVVNANGAVFYIDDVVVGSINLLVDAPTLGQPMSAAAVPLTMRTYHAGNAPALATQFKVSDVFVVLLGPDTSKPWAEAKAGMGHMASQGQNGGTMGSTANYANSANPTAAVPTNTTAALGVGLGGQFWETVTAAANLDGIIQSYLNPVGGVNQTPRNLVIRGVTYHCFNQVAIATVAWAKQNSLAYGHNALSLATAEAASFLAGGTTKAPRRIALGAIQPVAAVWTVYPQYTQRFDAPLVIAPGEYVALVSKNVGTVPASGVIAWLISFDAYWE